MANYEDLIAPLSEEFGNQRGCAAEVLLEAVPIEERFGIARQASNLAFQAGKGISTGGGSSYDYEQGGVTGQSVFIDTLNGTIIYSLTSDGKGNKHSESCKNVVPDTKK